MADLEAVILPARPASSGLCLKPCTYRASDKSGKDDGAAMAEARAGRPGDFGRPARQRGQHRLSRHHRKLWPALGDDPVGGHLLCPHPCQPDARLRTGRRHLRARTGLSRRPVVERRGLFLLRRGPELWLAAVLPVSARDRGRIDPELRPGSGNGPVSRRPARPGACRVHDDVRARLRCRPVARRDAGRSLGLAGGILVSRADRLDGDGFSNGGFRRLSASARASPST